MQIEEGVSEADNTLLDLHNSLYHTKGEFNNCFINYLLHDISRALRKPKFTLLSSVTNCKVDNIQ